MVEQAIVETVPSSGIEPDTPRFSAGCSARLSLEGVRGPGGNRTRFLRYAEPALYLVSFRPAVTASLPGVEPGPLRTSGARFISQCSRGELAGQCWPLRYKDKLLMRQRPGPETRTRCLLIPNQAGQPAPSSRKLITSRAVCCVAVAVVREGVRHVT